MSVYIGKNTVTNKAMLHITNGTTAQSSICNSPIASTVFHSDLPYLRCSKAYKPTAVTTNTPSGSLATYTWVTMGVDFINAVGNKWYFCVAGGSTNLTPYSNTILYSWAPLNNYTIAGRNDNLKPSSTNNSCIIIPTSFTGALTVNNIEFYIVDNMVNGEFVPYAPTSDTINIGNSTINIRGLDLYNVCFIQPAQINSTDTIVSADGSGQTTNKLQIINSKAAGSSLWLDCSTSGAQIKKGDNLIFSSNVLPKFKYKERSDWYSWNLFGASIVISAPRQSRTVTETTEVTTPFSGFSVGDMFCLSATFYNRGVPEPNTYVQGSPLQFRVGRIATLMNYENTYIGVLSDDLQMDCVDITYYTKMKFYLTGKADGKLYIERDMELRGTATSDPCPNAAKQYIPDTYGVTLTYTTNIFRFY